MAYIPFNMPLDADQEPEASAEIVEFPRHVAVQASLRDARRNLARCEHNVETKDPNSRDLAERLDAHISLEMIPFWRDAVRDAEAAVAMLDADDTLTFCGRVYQAHRSANGAN
jgi:hypothetical protein